MKTLKHIVILVAFLSAAASYSQESAPKFNADTNCLVRWYYFPNLEAYFDNNTNIFHYKENGVWVTNKEIPAGYKGYSFYKMAKVAIRDYEDEDVIQFLPAHKKKYPYTSNARNKRTTVYAD